ncbi:MAG TPA: hypothetical protein VFN56_04915 [Candidatus Saccharimonadales bacterium]|nr:hypothetical protein [Candidatus Saccharimonadales bacterium]
MPSTKSSADSSTKASSASKKVFDVSKPGKSAPSPSSKPIIITNRPIMRDPMMTSDSGTETTQADTTAIVKPRRELNLTPTMTAEALAQDAASTDQVTDSLPAEEPSVSAADSDLAAEAADADATPDVSAAIDVRPAEPADVVKADETPPTPVPDTAPTPAADAGSTESASTESPKEDTTDKPAPATDKQLSPEEQQAAEEEAAKAAAEHDAAIQKMIDAKQYFLPINTVEKRKTKHFIWAGVVLAVVLAVAWMDIALDAGLIHIAGIKAVTHFFSR